MFLGKLKEQYEINGFEEEEKTHKRKLPLLKSYINSVYWLALGESCFSGTFECMENYHSVQSVQFKSKP